MNSELLPIGTVVFLKNGNLPVFITGFYGSDSLKKEVRYDYIGFPYPEGFMSRDFVLLFNHVDIETVCYYGYVSDEEQSFKKKLSEVIEDERI